MMTSTCGLLCRFGVFACGKGRKVLFGSINHCIVYWPCCWEWSWMLQDMDHMETSQVVYVKVLTFDQLEQSKICVLMVISVGTVTLFVR
jgi:hypothetical protein